MDIGSLCGVAAFVMWGLLPIYWKQLDAVPSLQLVAHRVLWSSLTFVPLLWWWGGWRQIGGTLKCPGVLTRHVAAAILVSANWLGFVWGVTHGRMIECSLGYYLTPLVSVLLGVTVLRERLRPAQWVAVGIAAAGVSWIAAGYHEFPWIAIFLAATFSAYGLVKKKGALDPLPSLALETVLLLLPAIGYLATEQAAQRGGFGSHGAATDLLLAAAGPATVAPLFCFTVAVRRIPLSTVGLLQYIGPTLQFLVGSLIYGCALVVFAVDSLRHSAARRRSPDHEETNLPTVDS